MSEGLDDILLSRKEKRLLRQILRKKEVPDTFCNEYQKKTFLKYELITITYPQIISSSGRPVTLSNAPAHIKISDKAYRYFLYRKEAYFKGKLPVVISVIALVKSFDREIMMFIDFIINWLSK